MSFTNPINPTIRRRSIAGMEGMYAKMWDPPTASPKTPEFIDVNQELAQGNPQGLFPNPVPEFMLANGFLGGLSVPHTVQRDLMHGMTIPAWDGKVINYFLFRDADLGLGAFFPGPTIRVPQGCIFQCQTHGHGPPPHTIHWHGHEPTPMNDGVGHCSMELGDYRYQWQPNFVGTYFHHCHRNTVQHFEFGLYGMSLVETRDAYNPNYPINNADPNAPQSKDPGAYPRRTAANLSLLGFNQAQLDALGWVGGSIFDPDPLGVYPANPHAMTVEYDVEALWVTDDRDSIWSDRAKDARAFYPKANKRPGVDDTFFHGFFHDFNADYWFVTGVASDPRLVAGQGTPRRGPGFIGAIPPGVVVPPELNSGVTGMQVSINAKVDDTILVRHLNGAYNNIVTRFPVPIYIIAWDGRALGVPPFGLNKPYLVPAGTPIVQSVARRYDALILATAPTPPNTFATVEFYDTRTESAEFKQLVMNGATVPPLHTTRIPIVINP